MGDLLGGLLGGAGGAVPDEGGAGSPLNKLSAKKADPVDLDALFKFLNIDTSLLKNLKDLAGLIGDPSKLSKLLNGFINDQLGALGKMFGDTVSAFLGDAEGLLKDLAAQAKDALLSLIYIPDEVYLASLQVMAGAGSDLYYNYAFVKSTVLQHDMPKSLAWLNSQDHTTYDHTNGKYSQAITAAASGAWHVAEYIMDQMWASYRSYLATPATTPAAIKTKNSKVVFYQGYFHGVVKEIISKSYSNLTVADVSRMVNKYEIKPVAFGNSDTLFSKRYVINSGDINTIAPIYDSGFTAGINKIINSAELDKGNIIKFINPRNGNAKLIYLYLFSAETHGSNAMQNKPYYERMKMPIINLLAKSANDAFGNLLTTGLGKFVGNLITDYRHGIYLYTKEIAKYMYDPKKTINLSGYLAGFADPVVSVAPNENPLPTSSTKTAGQNSLTGNPTTTNTNLTTPPAEPADDPDIFDGINTKNYLVKAESDLGVDAESVSTSVVEIVEANTNFKGFKTRVILKTTPVPGTALKQTSQIKFYIFNAWGKSYSGPEVSDDILYKLIIKYLFDTYPGSQESIISQYSIPDNINSPSIFVSVRQSIALTVLKRVYGIRQFDDMYSILYSLKLAGAITHIGDKTTIDTAIVSTIETGNTILVTIEDLVAALGLSYNSISLNNKLSYANVIAKTNNKVYSELSYTLSLIEVEMMKRSAFSGVKSFRTDIFRAYCNGILLWSTPYASLTSLLKMIYQNSQDIEVIQIIPFPADTDSMVTKIKKTTNGSTSSSTPTDDIDIDNVTYLDLLNIIENGNLQQRSYIIGWRNGALDAVPIH